MTFYSHATENLDFIMLENVNQTESSNEEISNLISGTRIPYNYNPFETFSETNPTESRMQPYGNVFEEIPDFHLIEQITSPPNSVDGVYRFLKEATEAFHPIEQNNTAHSSRNDDEHLAMIKANNESLPVTRSFREKSSKPSIPLSKCVAITDSKPRKLQLVYPLEDTYRPRYKSDYFPQTGPVRRPRYIADNAANHFITLQLPNEYQHNLQHEYIRIALITTFIEGHGYYYSPYKFQKDHDDIKVPDENPIYIKVDTNQENQFIMRLQLVLIKSKLDQLNYIQPLKLFSDVTTNIQNIIHEKILSPKELITKYQLDKSHIAFTLCAKLPDDSYKSYSETTIISSVISEVSKARKPNEVAAAVATPWVDSNPHVCCPHCEHRFDPDTSSGSNDTNKRQSNHEISDFRSKTTKKNNNKRKKNS